MSVTRSARKLWGLSPADRRLAFEAVAALIAVRAALTLLPFGRLRGWLAGRRSAVARPGGPSPERISEAVTAAARHIPGCRCLAQALAGQILLLRHGYEARFCIGVTREGSRLAAHAWLEQNGRALIGGAVDLSGYTRLPSLDLDALDARR
jgi:hypothetical protein